MHLLRRIVHCLLLTLLADKQLLTTVPDELMEVVTQRASIGEFSTPTPPSLQACHLLPARIARRFHSHPRTPACLRPTGHQRAPGRSDAHGRRLNVPSVVFEGGGGGGGRQQPAAPPLVYAGRSAFPCPCPRHQALQFHLYTPLLWGTPLHCAALRMRRASRPGCKHARRRRGRRASPFLPARHPIFLPSGTDPLLCVARFEWLDL